MATINVIGEYILDIHEDDYKVMYVIQGEVNSRCVKITFYDNGSPYNITGLSLNLYMLKKDNTEIFNAGTIVDGTNGVALFPITSQMCLFSGEYELLFKIYGSNPTSELKVAGLKLFVREGNTDNGIISSNELNALQSALETVQTSIVQVNQALIDTQTAIINTNTAISNCNIAITNTNNATSATILAKDEANLAANTANQAAIEVKNYYQMTDPFTGNQNYVKEVVLEMFNYWFAGAITAKQLDDLNKTAQYIDGLGITSIDFDMKGKSLIV